MPESYLAMSSQISKLTDTQLAAFPFADTILSMRSQVMIFMSSITVDKVCPAATVTNWPPSINSSYPLTHVTAAIPILFSLSAPKEAVSLDGNCIC